MASLPLCQEHEAREEATRRKIAAKDLANQIRRKNTAKFRRDRSARVGHSQCEGHGVSRTGGPRRVPSPSSSAPMSDAIATGSGRGYLSRFQRDGTARAEASQLEHSPVSATGDARKMRSPPSRGQTAARGVIAAGSDRGHAAGSRRGSAAGFETSQQVRSRVSAAGYPHIFFSSMGWTTAGVVVDAARSARKSHEKRRQETMMALMARYRACTNILGGWLYCCEARTRLWSGHNYLF